jgi:hypothetical protein
MATTRSASSKEPSAGASKIMQEYAGVAVTTKTRPSKLRRTQDQSYSLSAEFDVLFADKRILHNEVYRRAKLRDMIHKQAILKRYTIRTEVLGGLYLKEQLDNGYPESEAYNRTLKLMATRKVND